MLPKSRDELAMLGSAEEEDGVVRLQLTYSCISALAPSRTRQL